MTPASKILCFTFSVAALLLLPGRAAAQFVYVTVPDANQVLVIQGPGNTIVDTIAVPGPRAIAITPDTRYVYVAEMPCPFVARVPVQE